jgi:hypothetical protein
MPNRLLWLAGPVAVLSLVAGAMNAQPGPGVIGGLPDLGDPPVVDREHFPPGQPAVPDAPRFVELPPEVKLAPLPPVDFSPSVVPILPLSKPEPPPWWLRYLPHAIIAFLGALGGAGASAAGRVRSAPTGRYQAPGSDWPPRSPTPEVSFLGADGKGGIWFRGRG